MLIFKKFILRIEKTSVRFFVVFQTETPSGLINKLGVEPF